MLFRSTYYLDAYRAEGGSLDAWTFEEGKWDNDTYLSVAYETMETARQAAGQLDSFFRWAEGRPHTDLLGTGGYDLYMETGLPWKTDRTWEQRICSQGIGDSLEEVLAQCAEPLLAYHAYYRLPTDDFTQEELDAFAEEAWP